MNKKRKANSRRELLKMGVALGVGSVVSKVLFSNNPKTYSDKPSEKIKLLTPEGELVEVEKQHICCTPVSNEESRQGIPYKKMVMVIDLAKCRNARKCIEGCQKMHHLPPSVEWIKMYLLRDSEDTAPYWFPKPCFHCNNAPCVKVCPVGATFKRTDGIVLVDNERCIGCKFCMAACPYSSRVFNWGEPNVDTESIEGAYSPETSTPGKIGTVGKCDFCPDMVRIGKLPSCVTACPNGVFYYGDKNLDTVTNGSETVRFNQLINDRAAYRYMEELGTEPSVFYLPPVDRMFNYEVGFKGLSEEDIELYKKDAGIIPITHQNE